jgi:choice-of-anchor C domain-containing protein
MAMRWTSLGAALTGVVVMAGAVSQATASPLLLDGNFDAPLGQSTPPEFTTYNAGLMGPWTVTGSVDLINTYWQSPTGAGTGSVDLDGNNVGEISQNISNLVINDNYILQFSLSGNPDGLPITKDLTVSVGSNSQPYTYTTGTNTHNDMMYEIETLSFKADATSMLLTFLSTDGSLNSEAFFGPVVGGVLVTAAGGVSTTPLPATWSLLLVGFAGLGFVAYRGTRNRCADIAAV